MTGKFSVVDGLIKLKKKIIFECYGKDCKPFFMHGCILNTVATDALVLKHQAISIHSAD